MNLESDLRDLGAYLDVPPPPDVTTAVLNRLDTPARRRVPRLVPALLAALLALATAMVVSPAVRAAVFDLFRIGGVEIRHDEPAPPVPTEKTPPPGERDLPLADARRAVDFPLRLPAGLGDPDSVRVTDDRVVSMVFGDVRIDQFDGTIDPIFQKYVGAEDVSQVTVAGQRGIWVNRPHLVLYTDDQGTVHDEAARLAGSTLIWTDADVTYRVEGDLTEAQALAIAESLR